jgi:hypothetical protein
MVMLTSNFASRKDAGAEFQLRVMFEEELTGEEKKILDALEWELIDFAEEHGFEIEDIFHQYCRSDFEWDTDWLYDNGERPDADPLIGYYIPNHIKEHEVCIEIVKRIKASPLYKKGLYRLLVGFKKQM